MNQRVANKIVKRMMFSDYRSKMISRLAKSKFESRTPSKCTYGGYGDWVETAKYDAYRLRRMDHLYDLPKLSEFLELVKIAGSRRAYMIVSSLLTDLKNGSLQSQGFMRSVEMIEKVLMDPCHEISA
jgi:hypothetical protein